MDGIEKGFILRSVTVSGEDRKYALYVPENYSPDKAWPTIVFLHGMGECGDNGLKQLRCGLPIAVMRDSEAWPFIILMPQTIDGDGHWEKEDDYLMAVLDATRNEVNVDDSRVYLTGLSLGGHGTWVTGSRHPDLFAAIAPICGWGERSMAVKLVDMPTWIFHGENDAVIPASAATVMHDYMTLKGGSPKLTVYEGVDHNSWDKAYRDEGLAAWFLEHCR